MDKLKEKALVDLVNARSVLLHARNTLGPDLGGHSMTDLLADNFPDWPLTKCKAIAAALVGAPPELPRPEAASGPSVPAGTSPERQAWLDIALAFEQLSVGYLDRFEFNVKWAKFMEKKELLRREKE